MRNERGFTILELAFVLTVAGILGAIAFHSISSAVPGKHLSGATMAFRSDLNRAKMEAMKSGRQYRVTVSGSNYTFSVGDLASGSTSWTTDATGSLPYPDVTFDNTSGYFIFDPRGTASQSANIVLTNDEGGTRTVSVTIAGRIRSS